MARLVQIGAVVLLVVSGTLLPWATYRSPQANQTTIFRGGALGLVLVALGGVFIVVSLVPEARGLRRLNVLVALAAIIVSVVGALSKIRAANDAASHAAAGSGSSQTSYAIGAVLALLAALVIAISAFIDLTPQARTSG